MSTSFDEACEAVAKRRKITYEEAALIVAEEYGEVATFEDESDDSLLLDDVDATEAWLREYDMSCGKVVRVDEDRSPAGLIQAQAERMEARRTGDRYRELSRRTSLHLGMDR